MRAVLAGVGVGVVLSGLIVAVVVPMGSSAWHTPVTVWGITATVVALSVLAIGRVVRRE